MVNKTSLDSLKDKFIGEKGSIKRKQYEVELQLDLIGEMIRNARKERNLTQEQLGELVGVQKAQISKLEKGSKNVTLATIIKIFEALKANIKFHIDFPDTNLA